MRVRNVGSRVEFHLRSHRWFSAGSVCVALIISSVALSGCLFGITGSSRPTLQQQEDQYFAQARELQKAADQCSTTQCRDAELTAAISVYEKVLKLNPLSQIAYFDMGVIYTSSGQLSSATTALGKALLIQPTYFPALYNLAYVDSETGDTTSAISLYQQAAAVKSATPAERAEAYFNLGYLLDTTGKRAEGDAAFTQAVNLDSSLASKIPAKFAPAGLGASTPTTTSTTLAVPGILPSSS